VPCPAHLARSRTSRSQPRRTLVVRTASPPVQAEAAAVAHCAQSCEAAWPAAQQSVTAGEREKRRWVHAAVADKGRWVHAAVADKGRWCARCGRG
jgi:hypothetical protein